MNAITHQIEESLIVWQLHHQVEHLNICAILRKKNIILIGYDSAI